MDQSSLGRIMLDTYVRQTLLTVLCILEVGMCFKLACLVLKGELILTKMQRTGIVLGMLVIGAGLAYNRNLLFFSDQMWILVMVIVGVWSCVLLRYRLILVAELVVLYMSTVALLDFFFAFLGMSYLQGEFWHLVYYRAISWWSILIYLCARGLVFFGVIFIGRHLRSGMDLVRFQKILFPICIVVCVLVRFFRVLLMVIAERIFDMRAWSVGVALLACLLLLLFFAVFLYFVGMVEKHRAEQPHDIVTYSNYSIISLLILNKKDIIVRNVSFLPDNAPQTHSQLGDKNSTFLSHKSFVRN